MASASKTRSSSRLQRKPTTESSPSISPRANARSTKQTNAPWTKAEDNLLREGIFRFGPKRWRDIAALFSASVLTPNQRKRSTDACNARWRVLTSHDAVVNKAKWTPDEDAMLKRLATKYKEQRWSIVASFLEGRNAKQCRERFKNQICVSLNHAPWTRAEDDAIIRSQAIHGNRWALVAEKLPGRTDNMVKNRWYSTLERIAQSRRQELMEINATAAKRKRVPIERTRPKKRMKGKPSIPRRKVSRARVVLASTKKQRQQQSADQEEERKNVLAEKVDDTKMEKVELHQEMMVHSPDTVDAAVCLEWEDAVTHGLLSTEGERANCEDEENELRKDDFKNDDMDPEEYICEWVPHGIMPADLGGLGSSIDWLDDGTEALWREKDWEM